MSSPVAKTEKKSIKILMVCNNDESGMGYSSYIPVNRADTVNILLIASLKLSKNVPNRT